MYDIGLHSYHLLSFFPYQSSVGSRQLLFLLCLYRRVIDMQLEVHRRVLEAAKDKRLNADHFQTTVEYNDMVSIA